MLYVHRARHSTLSLRATFNFLARYTKVEQIKIISYSAGGRVLSKALHEMRSAEPELSAEELKKKYRIATVSDDDNALRAAR